VLKNLITTNDREFDQEDWSEFSPEARDFVDKLIEPSLNRRMSAAQALKHPWISKFVAKPRIVKDGDLLDSCCFTRE